jgi:hypothetical protein
MRRKLFVAVRFVGAQPPTVVESALAAPVKSDPDPSASELGFLDLLVFLTLACSSGTVLLGTVAWLLLG